MAIMDHQPVGDEVATGVQHCIWCHDLWPCRTAQVRHELAGYIRALPLGGTGCPDYDAGREAQRDSIADTIDI